MIKEGNKRIKKGTENRGNRIGKERTEKRGSMTEEKKGRENYYEREKEEEEKEKRERGR